MENDSVARQLVHDSLHVKYTVLLSPYDAVSAQKPELTLAIWHYLTPSTRSLLR